MSDTPPLGVLQRATDNRLSGGGEVTDVRHWRDRYGARGEMGLIPAAVLVVAFVVEMFTGGPEGWGLSGQALAEGRWATIGLHMIAHGGLSHLIGNVSALMVFAPIALRCFGPILPAWGRWLVLFVGAGLCGAALFLLVNPAGVVPMVGASGAICGLWGFAVRIGPYSQLVRLTAPSVGKAVVRFAVINAILFALLFALTRAAGGVGGLAGEAHLGGFLFGLLLAPVLYPPRLRPVPVEEPVEAPAETAPEA